MARVEQSTSRLRHGGPTVFDCQPRRDPGVACSRLVRLIDLANFRVWSEFFNLKNLLRILQTLDRHLTAPAEMTLFGRAAMALGYSGSPAAFGATHDVDAILFLSWLEAEDEHLDFWQAQHQTNAELEPEGLGSAGN